MRTITPEMSVGNSGIGEGEMFVVGVGVGLGSVFSLTRIL
jgi:hypothetical protein